MPNFNKTGPGGMGPMTGRGFGPCGMRMGWRNKFGRGRGMGRYFGWGYPETKEDEKKALEEYKNALKEELEDLEKMEKELK